MMILKTKVISLKACHFLIVLLYFPVVYAFTVIYIHGHIQGPHYLMMPGCISLPNSHSETSRW